MREGIIYRLVHSPTEVSYLVVVAGVIVECHSMKRAKQAAGTDDAPVLNYFVQEVSDEQG